VTRIKNELGWGFIKAFFLSLPFIPLNSFNLYAACDTERSLFPFFSPSAMGSDSLKMFLKNRFGVCRLNAKRLKLLRFYGLYVFYMYVLGNRESYSLFASLWWSSFPIRADKVAALEVELNSTCIRRERREGKLRHQAEKGRWNFNFDFLLPLRF
jgi:hypothetical protein